MYELFIPINNSKFQTMDKFEMLLTEDVKVLQTSFLCHIYFPCNKLFLRQHINSTTTTLLSANGLNLDF